MIKFVLASLLLGIIVYWIADMVSHAYQRAKRKRTEYKDKFISAEVRWIGKHIDVHRKEKKDRLNPTDMYGELMYLINEMQSVNDGSWIY